MGTVLKILVYMDYHFSFAMFLPVLNQITIFFSEVAFDVFLNRRFKNSPGNLSGESAGVEFMSTFKVALKVLG